MSENERVKTGHFELRIPADADIDTVFVGFERDGERRVLAEREPPVQVTMSNCIDRLTETDEDTERVHKWSAIRPIRFGGTRRPPPQR